MTKLPHFPYHRDPIASGSVRESQSPCQCCGKAPGLLYQGVVYSANAPDNLCPWCIADGSATDKYDADFFDGHFVDDEDDYLDLDAAWHREVFGKTIGFATYNPIGWWVHCGEPAEFVTRQEPYEMVFECRRCAKRHLVGDYD